MEGLSVFWWEWILEGIGLGFWLGVCFLVRLGGGGEREGASMSYSYGLQRYHVWV